MKRSPAEQCLDDHAQAQKFEQTGLLIESRERFIACSADECPSAVRIECATQADRVNDKIPTVVLSLRNYDSTDVTEASAWLGDKLVAARLDGRALPMNPGRYEFEFRTDAGDQVKVSAVLREGEKHREVSAALSRPAVPLETPVAPPVTPAPLERDRTAAYVTWGVGGAALAAFGALAVVGKLSEDCRPACSDAEVDQVRNLYLAADISLVTAAAAGTLGLTFYLTAPAKEPESPSAAAPAPRIALGVRGNTLQFWGNF